MYFKWNDQRNQKVIIPNDQILVAVVFTTIFKVVYIRRFSDKINNPGITWLYFGQLLIKMLT